MARSSALIIGHTGQDGFYLGQFLRTQGKSVTGVSSKSVEPAVAGVAAPVDIRASDQVQQLIRVTLPDEIYYLAAWHHSSQDIQPETRQTFTNSQIVHCDGFLNVLDAVVQRQPKARVFYAASSHIFGKIFYSPQDEAHPVRPDNIYGVTKAYGMEIARYYRDHHGVHCCCGILYNHESPRRDRKFLSRKIAMGIADILKGRQNSLRIGNPDAVVDWGYAGDYVRAMHAGLNLDRPQDFIIASGKPHTVREFAELAFSVGGLPIGNHLEIDDGFRGKPEPDKPRIGDPSLLRRLSGWRPEVSFEDMVTDLVRDAIASGQEHD